MELREPRPSDIGQMAYIIMCWHRELPPERRFWQGEAWQAERTAELLAYAPPYLTKLLMDGDKIVGAVSLVRNKAGVFSPEPYGSILIWYVRPEYRGQQRIGFKLLKDIIASAAAEGMSRIEANPWFDDRGTMAVLKRLGFEPFCTTFSMGLKQ